MPVAAATSKEADEVCDSAFKRAADEGREGNEEEEEEGSETSGISAMVDGVKGRAINLVEVDDLLFFSTLFLRLVTFMPLPFFFPGDVPSDKEDND